MNYEKLNCSLVYWKSTVIKNYDRFTGVVMKKSETIIISKEKDKTIIKYVIIC